MRCDICGNNTVERTKIEGFVVDECSVCGEIVADPETLETIETIREAVQLGIEPEIYPLVKVLNKLPGFETFSSCEGHPVEGLKPNVMFRITEGGLESLRRLLTSLKLANREIRGHWVIEAELQPDLCFVLKPKIEPRYDERWKGDIIKFQRDVKTLVNCFERDRHLAIWAKPEVKKKSTV
ncbi:MAG: hypothetical protein NUW37_17185 [Planctomycetes bacterium]|nr:hypothetical protein [Planctomycetota bacterium]